MKTPEHNTSRRIDMLHQLIQAETDPAKLRWLWAQLRKLERNIR